MAFRIAAAAAVREGMRAAQPAVLEPIMNLEVTNNTHEPALV